MSTPDAQGNLKTSGPEMTGSLDKLEMTPVSVRAFEPRGLAREIL